jgi:hypothetical protein
MGFLCKTYDAIFSGNESLGVLNVDFIKSARALKRKITNGEHYSKRKTSVKNEGMRRMTTTTTTFN